MSNEDKITEIHADVKKISKILLGNGEVGLCEKVRDLEHFQAKIEKRPQNIHTYLLIGVSALTIVALIKGFWG